MLNQLYLLACSLWNLVAIAGVGDVIFYSPFSFLFQPSLSLQDFSCIFEEIRRMVHKQGWLFGRRLYVLHKMQEEMIEIFSHSLLDFVK
mmetsp:Transcript_1612/g.2932  ORF Transcript_1612/g.2932 Transcript_1612/m.2932 type:complete len:89 (+) Transcript_1612:309-575(+)